MKRIYICINFCSHLYTFFLFSYFFFFLLVQIPVTIVLLSDWYQRENNFCAMSVFTSLLKSFELRDIQIDTHRTYRRQNRREEAAEHLPGEPTWMNGRTRSGCVEKDRHCLELQLIEILRKPRSPTSCKDTAQTQRRRRSFLWKVRTMYFMVVESFSPKWNLQIICEEHGLKISQSGRLSAIVWCVFPYC